MKASFSPWKLDFTEDGDGEGDDLGLKRGDWTLHHDLGERGQTLTLSVDGLRVVSLHFADGITIINDDLDRIIRNFTNQCSTPLIARIAILEHQLQVAVKALADRQS